MATPARKAGRLNTALPLSPSLQMESSSLTFSSAAEHMLRRPPLPRSRSIVIIPAPISNRHFLGTHRPVQLGKQVSKRLQTLPSPSAPLNLVLSPMQTSEATTSSASPVSACFLENHTHLLQMSSSLTASRQPPTPRNLSIPPERQTG